MVRVFASLLSNHHGNSKVFDLMKHDHEKTLGSVNQASLRRQWVYMIIIGKLSHCGQ